MASLEIESLCFSVGSHDILRSVDLQLEDGRCLALLGPSGCGKTTTLRCIAGFIRPTSGRIAFNGQSVIERPVHRRNVGLVFQDYALFPHMNVMENISYGLRRRGVDARERRRRIDDVLSLVQLESFAERLPRQLSGGQQQRVALARAIVIQPDVLLLDEPLGALDRKLRDQMQVELKRIQRETGTTTIIVTHDQEEALSLSDRLAVMLDGRIEAVGEPGALYRQPGSRAVMEFLGASNIFAATVTEVRGEESRLRICDGIEFRLPRALEVGSRVQVGIRPEQFTASTAAPAGSDNVIPGTVTEAIFKGSHAELHVRGPDGTDIVVQQRIGNTGENDAPVIGGPVFLSVDPDAIVIFERG